MRGKGIYLHLSVLAVVTLLLTAFMVMYLGGMRPRYYLWLSVLPMLIALIQLTRVSRVNSLDVSSHGQTLMQKIILQAYPVLGGLLSFASLGYVFWDASLLNEINSFNWYPIYGTIVILTWVGIQLAEDKMVSQEKNSALSYLSGQVESLNVRESTLLDKIVNGVIVLDPEGSVLTINSAALKLLVTTEADSIKQPFDHILHPSEDGVKYHDNYDPVGGFKKRVLESKKTLTITEMNFIDGEGKQKTFNITINPIYNKQEKLTRIMIILQDVSLNYELEKMRMDFVSIASHELRTPLTSINGYLSLLMNEGADESDSRLYVERISQSVGRLSKLVKSILNVSRIEQNRMKVDKKPVSLYRIANDELANFIPLAEEKKITLYALPAVYEQQRVEADEDMLREVIMNYVSNSIKYSNEGGEVHLRIRDDAPGALRLEVRDNGIGIDEKHVGNLFSQFYRVDSDLVQQQQGTGLGLYIAKRYVETMGGKIGVESKLGKGSTFYFDLKRVEDAPAITLDEAQMAQIGQKSVSQPVAEIAPVDIGTGVLTTEAAPQEAASEIAPDTDNAAVIAAAVVEEQSVEETPSVIAEADHAVEGDSTQQTPSAEEFYLSNKPAQATPEVEEATPEKVPAPHQEGIGG